MRLPSSGRRRPGPLAIRDTGSARRAEPECSVHAQTSRPRSTLPVMLRIELAGVMRVKNVCGGRWLPTARAVGRLCFVIRKARSMKPFLALSALLVLIASPVSLETSAAGQTAANQHQEMVKAYCANCHSARARMGGLALEGLNLEAAADNAEIWEKALR